MPDKFLRTERGFTIIELLTVLVIISVLTTISIVAYNGVREKARLARVKTNVSEIVVSLDNYATDNFTRYPALTQYHVQLPPSGSYETDPNPPAPPAAGEPPVLVWMGNAVIGGSPGLVDTGNPLQDDFYRDMLPSPPDTTSFFRDLPNQNAYGDGPMTVVDELAKTGRLEAYPVNPLRGPGIPMVNIAHMLYVYDAYANNYQWVDFTVDANGELRTGLCAARPAREGVYEPIPVIWNEDTYPQGDFAYIPFNVNPQGKTCEGYWIICYGDTETLYNSPYNKYALDPLLNDFDPNFANWPNFPPPYGDGDPTSPPVQGTVEFEIKRLMQGALDVRATIYQDQLVQTEQ